MYKKAALNCQPCQKGISHSAVLVSFRPRIKGTNILENMGKIGVITITAGSMAIFMTCNPNSGVHFFFKITSQWLLKLFLVCRTKCPADIQLCRWKVIGLNCSTLTTAGQNVRKCLSSLSDISKSCRTCQACPAYLAITANYQMNQSHIVLRVYYGRQFACNELQVCRKLQLREELQCLIMYDLIYW